MILRLLFIIGLAVSVSACGVKNNLLLPTGKDNPKGHTDPSKPPQPLGQ